MNRVQQFAQLLLTLAVAAAVGFGAWKLATLPSGESKLDKPSPPATVVKVVKEDELNTITLTELAASRLGLKTAPIEKKTIRRNRLYGGDVTIPVGKTIIVSAPVSGILRTSKTAMPRPGQTVKKGDAVLELLPLLTPESQTTLATQLVEVNGLIDSAQTNVALAKSNLDRETNLLKKEAGSQKNVEAAQAAYDVAVNTLDANKDRKALLAKVLGESSSGTAAPISIPAPENGQLRTISALPGQMVASGGTLFEIVDLSTIWVRVPVSVGELDGLALDQPANLGPLSESAKSPPVPATPVAAPPSANAATGTVDVYYEAANPGGRWIPGQRVGVSIPLNESADSVTVAWSAVIYDVHGGSWIYEQTAPRTFVRRRVVIRQTIGTDAILAGGLNPGTVVVVAGSQELFASETGYTK